MKGIVAVCRLHQIFRPRGGGVSIVSRGVLDGLAVLERAPEECPLFDCVFRFYFPPLYCVVWRLWLVSDHDASRARGTDGPAGHTPAAGRGVKFGESGECEVVGSAAANCHTGDCYVAGGGVDVYEDEDCEEGFC